jgi:hypothetical protein
MLSLDVLKIISEYACEYYLKGWIDEKMIKWDYLSYNPAAIHILEKNMEKVDWII